MARSGIDLTERFETSVGLRVITRRLPKSPVECCGVAILAGSSDETPDEYGLAHFVEHTIFKGTQRRRSHHIINRMEVVGGELNAYTTKEETFVYTLAPAGNLSRSVELLGDLIANCTFPAVELDREREVVAEEIDSYLDTPMEAVYDDFEDIIFKGTPLGHNILGTRDSIAEFDSGACRIWVERHYIPSRMVFFYAGPARPERVTKLVESCFSEFKTSSSIAQNDISSPLVPPPGFDQIRHIGSHQAHTIMGCIVGGLRSPDRYPLALINNILGGPGMNSRLNVALRERRGLVYSVDSSLASYSGCGLFTVYFGCDSSDIELCRRLVTEEIERLAASPMSDRAIAMARRQYLGQLIVSGVSVEQTALTLGRATLRGLDSPDSTRLAEIMAQITPETLRRVATSLSPLSVLTLA